MLIRLLSLAVFSLFFVGAAQGQELGAFDAEAFASADVERGSKIFRKCSACHQIGADAKNRVGPILTGVVGRPVASVADYKYGKDISAYADTGAVWSRETIFQWLGSPRDFLRANLDDPKAKTKMTLRLKKESERYDIIAYLESVSE